MAVVVGHGEPPLCAPELPGHDGTGDRREDRAEPGDLPGPLVEPDQRGQPDPDLDADSYRDVRARLRRTAGRDRFGRDWFGRAGVRLGVVVRGALRSVLGARLAEERGDDLVL